MTARAVIRGVDRLLRGTLTIACSALLALMVGFVIYTVVMRTVFLAPPFWGDTLALFANIWLVMLAFALAVRDRANIAMEAVHAILPDAVARWLRRLWTALFGLVGLLMLGPGHEAASRILGRYWELGNLPKSVPMTILPVAGALIMLAAALALLDDDAPGVADEPDHREGRAKRPAPGKEDTP